MSSDSDHTYPVNKRKKLVITDSDNSDESIIVQTRRRKKIYRVVSEEESSDDDSDVPKPVIRRQKNYRVTSEDESKYDSASEANKSALIARVTDTNTSSSDTSEWQNDCTSSDELDKDPKKYNTKRKVLSNYDSSASEANTSTQIDNNSDTSSIWQSDWNSSELDEDIKHNSKRKILSKTKKKKSDKSAPSSANVNIDSDNSDGQLEKCPICLLPFRKQQVGTPSACEHCFCLECLLEWSKNINTCPVDRQVFTSIHVRNHLGGKVMKNLPVQVVPRPEDQVQDDPTFCEVCHLSDREDRMLLCDGCDCGYHLECLTPPMTEVPMEEWFCPECSQNSQNDAEAIEIDLDEISDLMEEARRLGVSYGRTRTGTTPESGASIPRIVPRTRQIERVRATIRNRTVRNTITNIRFIDPNQPSTSSGLDSIGDNSHSPNANFHACGSNTSSTRSSGTSKTKTTKKKKNKRAKKSTSKSSNTVVREVRIREINDDGEEEEIVTYVKVASSTSRGKCKKQRKRKRKL